MLTRKVTKDLCLHTMLAPKKSQLTSNRTEYPITMSSSQSPDCYIMSLFTFFYLKDHSKEAYNEVALESIYRLINGYSADYVLVVINYVYRVTT